MPVPVVTRRHLEQAWIEITGAPNVFEPVAWNQEVVREFLLEVPTVSSVMVAASAKRYRRKERAAAATWIAAWLYRGFKTAGARFASVPQQELMAMLTAEHEHLVKVSKEQGMGMVDAEVRHLTKMPNGDLLELLMQVWGNACQQVSTQGEDPSLLAQDAYFTRLHLAVILVGLNRSAELAAEENQSR